MTEEQTTTATTEAAAPAPQAKAPRAAKAKPLDFERIDRLQAYIGERLPSADLTNLLHQLETEQDAKIGERKGDSVFRVAMAGIEAGSTAGPRGALANWCNAARRALLERG